MLWRRSVEALATYKAGYFVRFLCSWWNKWESLQLLPAAPSSQVSFLSPAKFSPRQDLKQIKIPLLSLPSLRRLAGHFSSMLKICQKEKNRIKKENTKLSNTFLVWNKQTKLKTKRAQTCSLLRLRPHSLPNQRLFKDLLHLVSMFFSGWPSPGHS